MNSGVISASRTPTKIKLPPALARNSEFAGAGPFLTALNAPKNPAGDEVTGPVKWLTLRSDRNDKYAQLDGQ